MPGWLNSFHEERLCWEILPPACKAKDQGQARDTGLKAEERQGRREVGEKGGEEQKGRGDSI